MQKANLFLHISFLFLSFEELFLQLIRLENKIEMGEGNEIEYIDDNEFLPASSLMLREKAEAGPLLLKILVPAYAAGSIIGKILSGLSLSF